MFRGSLGGHSPPGYHQFSDSSPARRAGQPTDNHQIMKTAYVANCNLPNHFAHAVQIMKNAQAWNRKSDEFQFVSNLSLRNWLRADEDKINEFYGISDTFNMKLYPLLDVTGKRWSPVNELYYRKAAKFLHSWGAELVFTRTFSLPHYSLPLQMPTLVETHGQPGNSDEKNALYKRLDDKNFLGIVTISDTLRDMYIEHGLPAEKILTADDGADLSMFEKPENKKSEARRFLGYPEEGQYALYVGHLYDDRGIQDIMEAAKRYPEVEFIFVGGHPGDVKRWRERLASSQLKNVQFVGFVRNQSITNYLWMADVLLMPYSRKCPTADWMSPLKMFEYMAAGRPIIASDLDAIKHVLTHGEDAWLVAADDAVSLGDGIGHILGDQETFKPIGNGIVGESTKILLGGKGGAKLWIFAKERLP